MKRQDILSEAWGESGQRFGAFEAGPLSTHRLRLLERRGNRFFGGGEDQSETEALAEVLFVLTTPHEQLKELRKLDAAEWSERVDDRYFDLTEDQAAEFQGFIQEKIQYLNAAATESEASGKPDIPQLNHV